MNSVSYVGTMERWQARVLRWMTGLSLLFHAGLILLGSTVSSLFPQAVVPPVVIVELLDAPMSTLLEEEPPPPSPVIRETVASPSRQPAPLPPAAARPSQAEQWLKKLDAGLVKVSEAPVSRKTGKPGGIPVRHWETGANPRPGDFAPAVAPENKALLRQISDLEGKIRAGGVPGVGVGVGGEVEVSAMFGGTGTAGEDPIPPWIRDMIRRRVREHLPELEALYSAAFRRDPAIRGKLLVRFRIDPSGRVLRAEPGGSPLQDDTFVESVLTKIRGWTFDPTDGRTVEVLYPFIFIAPS